MVDECGAVVGMRIGRGNGSTGKTLRQCHFVHEKSHMTSPGIIPRPPHLETLGLADQYPGTPIDYRPRLVLRGPSPEAATL
jgi:hypothetical protein